MADRSSQATPPPLHLVDADTTVSPPPGAFPCAESIAAPAPLSPQHFPSPTHSSSSALPIGVGASPSRLTPPLGNADLPPASPDHCSSVEPSLAPEFEAICQQQARSLRHALISQSQRVAALTQQLTRVTERFASASSTYDSMAIRLSNLTEDYRTLKEAHLATADVALRVQVLETELTDTQARLRQAQMELARRDSLLPSTPVSGHTLASVPVAAHRPTTAPVPPGVNPALLTLCAGNAMSFAFAVGRMVAPHPQVSAWVESLIQSSSTSSVPALDHLFQVVRTVALAPSSPTTSSAEPTSTPRPPSS
jgi:hypothetical protein